MSDQMVFKRYEMKYMLSRAQKEQLMQAMQGHMKADEHGQSRILSLYMDTPDFLLARRSMDHPFYKEKLRLRSYGVAQKDTTVFVELKKKYDGIVYKRRASMTLEELERYLKTGEPPKDGQIMREIDYARKRYIGIQPAILLSYDREAFYAEDGSGFRMTFDENILWRNRDVTLDSGIYGLPLLREDQVLLEVKTAGALPRWLVDELSECRIYQTAFSKYASAYRNICTGVQPAQHEIITDGGIYQYA
jgi:SPX domain protein involved in polyphosphate accumulation